MESQEKAGRTPAAKRNVMITIKGIQDIEGETDSIELTTEGSFYRKNDVYYLSYRESEITGYEGCVTTLKVMPGRKVVMTRLGGGGRSQLVVEKGVRHQCLYDTGCGEMTIGVMGHGFSGSLTDEGGEISFAYSLDVNTSLASKNHVIINVE